MIWVIKTGLVHISIEIGLVSKFLGYMKMKFLTWVEPINIWSCS